MLKPDGTDAADVPVLVELAVWWTTISVVAISTTTSAPAITSAQGRMRRALPGVGSVATGADNAAEEASAGASSVGGVVPCSSSGSMRFSLQAASAGPDARFGVRLPRIVPD